MPHVLMTSDWSDGSRRLLVDLVFSRTTSDIMFDLARFGQSCILKYSKAVSWLKASLERDTRFRQFFISNNVMPLRLWNAKIRSSSTLNSLDSIVNHPEFILIFGTVGTPLMEKSEIRAEGGRGCDTVKQGQSWMVSLRRVGNHLF
jgi:hypothetical protein